MQEHPFVFGGGLLFVFGMGIWIFALFPRCEQALIPLIGCCVCFLTVARTCRKVMQATPSCSVLGSDSDQACVGGTHAWNILQRPKQGRCVLRGVRATVDCSALSLPTTEVTRASG